VLYTVPFGIKIIPHIFHYWVYKKEIGKIKFQGWHFQDMVAYLYLQKKNDGFFVDIGANDGIIGSNTFIFEKLGWHGVCVEPLPAVFNHKLKRSRKCDCYNVAISSKSNDSVEFFQAVGANQLSGLNEGMTESHKMEAKTYGKTKIINVKTMTFDDIMGNYPDIKFIDFMSIDVEGHEMEILNTINFKKYKFGFLTIERSEPERIVKHMQENGYQKLMDLGPDMMFVPNAVC
jgi:FkbM family methyltransferase